MWIVNWGRLLVFVAMTAAIWFAYKALYGISFEWAAVIIAVALFVAWLIDRIDSRHKE